MKFKNKFDKKQEFNISNTQISIRQFLELLEPFDDSIKNPTQALKMHFELWFLCKSTRHRPNIQAALKQTPKTFSPNVGIFVVMMSELSCPWTKDSFFVNKINLKWFSHRVNASLNKSSFHQRPGEWQIKNVFWRDEIWFSATLSH